MLASPGGRRDTDNDMIRPYKPEDLKAVVDLANLAWRDIYARYKDAIDPDLIDALIPNPDAAKGEEVGGFCRDYGHWVRVYELDGGIVAFVTFRIDKAKGLGIISNNAVHPDYRGRGIAREMYTAVLDHFRELGMKYAHVVTGLDDAHAPARKVYKRVGFNIEWPTVRYYMKL
jgi:ribosomal protein S18 acetylase RimI-like enzyme